jgi:hypothetical protein
VGIFRGTFKLVEAVATVLILAIVMTWISVSREDSALEPATFLSPTIPIPVTADTRPQTKELIESAWPRVRQHCPGLDKYHSDLTYRGLEDYTDLALKRVEIVFRVAQTPRSMPAGMSIAGGRTCHLGLTANGKGLIIREHECISLCLDRLQFSGPSSYEAAI